MYTTIKHLRCRTKIPRLFFQRFNSGNFHFQLKNLFTNLSHLK
jgi:hypothetical protein